MGLGGNRNVRRTNWMWSDRICVDAEQWDSDERPIPSQSQHSVPELQGNMVLFRISLVKIDI